MIKDAAFTPGQAEGLRIADEVNLVAECSQFNAEFGGNDAAAAVSWIARDSDAHRPASYDDAPQPKDSLIQLKG